MTAKVLMGSALLMVLVGCGGAKSEATVSGTDPQSISTSPAGVATLAFVDLEGGYRLDQLPTAVQNPMGDALMLEAGPAPVGGCTSAATTLNGTTATTTVTFTNCASASGATLNGTLVLQATTSGSTRSVTTTYDLTTLDTTGKKKWTYVGAKLSTINTLTKQATVTVPTGGSGVAVTYTDGDNSANNKAYVYAPNLTLNWATPGQFKVWGSYTFTQNATSVLGTIQATEPLVWVYGSCCYPVSGTLTLATGGLSAKAVFGPACGALILNGADITLQACR